MTTEKTLGKVGRPQGSGKKKPDDKSVKLVLSRAQFAYLTWLVEKTKLGRTEDIVALVLLTQKLEEMSPSDFLETKSLPKEGDI